MRDFLETLLVMLGPVWLAAGVLLLISTAYQHKRAAQWLRRVTVFCWVIVTAVDLLVVFAIAACRGSALYGYSDCTNFNVDIANHSLISFVYVTSAAFILCLLTLIGTLIREIRSRIRASRARSS